MAGGFAAEGLAVTGLAAGRGAAGRFVGFAGGGGGGACRVKASCVEGQGQGSGDRHEIRAIELHTRSMTRRAVLTADCSNEALSEAHAQATLGPGGAAHKHPDVDLA